jgi:hypothetical protein
MKMTPDELAAILKLHAEWLEDENTGHRADLTEAKLTRANLFRADLSGANLSEADLSRANLSRANLTQADLTGADLSEAQDHGEWGDDSDSDQPDDDAKRWTIPAPGQVRVRPWELDALRRYADGETAASVAASIGTPTRTVDGCFRRWAKTGALAGSHRYNSGVRWRGP